MKKFLPYPNFGLLVLLMGLWLIFPPMPAHAFQLPVQQAGAKDCEEKSWYPDNDKDGFGAEGSAAIRACDQPQGYSYNDWDCDDERAAVNPYADEKIRDGVDNNCDGQVDETPDGTGAPVFNFVDAGFNGFVGEAVHFTIKAVDPQIGDVVTLRFDSVSISSAANGYAYHLEGASFSPSLPLTATDSATTSMTWIPSEEQRGFLELYFSATDQQGNTSQATIYPFVDFKLVVNPLPPLTIGINEPFVTYLTSTRQMELSEEVILENAPDWLQAAVMQVPDPGYLNTIKIWGTPPEGSEGTYTPTAYFRSIMGQDSSLEFQLTVADCQNQLWYADKDGDGYGGASVTACEQAAGFIAMGGDCNDEDATVNPSATEIMDDGLDNDCDGRIDIFPGTPRILFSTGNEINSFLGSTTNIVVQAIDANKGDVVTLKLDSIWSGSREAYVYELEGATFAPPLPTTAPDTATTIINWVPQQDQLGFAVFFFSAVDQDGNKTQAALTAYVYPSQLTLNPIADLVVGTEQFFQVYMTIADDRYHSVNSQVLLENAPSWLKAARIFGAQIGQLNAIAVWGTPPPGSWGIYRPTVHVTTAYGLEDRQQIQIRVGNCQNKQWYADNDGDGFGGERYLNACYQPAGFVSTSGDCKDEDPSLYPGATELMDNIDNNCNGEVDEQGSCSASGVVSFRQGSRPDGKPIGWERSRPALALGAPQENDYFNFVSLGFGGELVLELGSLVYDDGTEAPDLMVVETTWGWAWRHCYDGELAGNPETMVMEVSANGTDWLNIPGTFCRNAKVDLSTVVGEGKLPYVRYVKITDTSNPADFPAHANGYDVDGIITCPALFDEMQTNSRIAGSFNANFFNNALEEEELLQQLAFYPNPVKHRITIQAGTSEKLEVKIYAMNGALLYKELHQAESASGEIRLNLSGLAKGIYLIHLQGRQLQEYIKIMKE